MNFLMLVVEVCTLYLNTEMICLFAYDRVYYISHWHGNLMNTNGNFCGIL